LTRGCGILLLKPSIVECEWMLVYSADEALFNRIVKK
jgi:hypothetical protein